MSIDKLPTTPAGLRRLNQRLAAARQRYLDICADNEDAAGAGDTSVWHDNFAYEENQRQMHAAARTVRDLEHLLRRMQVVHPVERPSQATVGTEVTFSDEDGEEHRWILGGYEDSDPAEGRVAYTTPLGQALMGARPGELRQWPRGGRRVEIEITAICRAHSETSA
ncbi:MAG: GreA/GreB family elongation factor [Myxococcales bacterium]|nr:GreA/GreB family elongation factor [Myxococcales bacterium]MCB9524031.1 GreA/GreB family elongation factor [Myxococcales bacterium]